VRLILCGVRGSTPAPGNEFLHYGGHTSCVAISKGDEAPCLVLDGGTGIRRVSQLWGDEPFRGTVLLSHLHWDHTQGLPFFAAGARPGHRVNAFLPAPDGEPLEILTRGFSPPHFPIGPEKLGDGWTFDRLSEGFAEHEGFRVLAREIPHKGGQTFGFRVEHGGSSVAYLSDHAPLNLGPGSDGEGDLHEAALQLANGVDLLIHDAQYLGREFPGVAFLGHASIEYACSLAEAAAARSLVLFHHAPSRTDREIDAIVDALPPSKVDIRAAEEGMVIEL
jgi:phosphoribosyl 1,2-cyclic phosphodiesterase